MASSFKSNAAVAVCMLLLIIGTVESKKKDYNGFSVLRCKPGTVVQVDKLRELMFKTGEEAHDQVQFWTEPVGLERSVDISVGPDYNSTLQKELEKLGLKCETIIKDLAVQIRKSSPTMTRSELSNSTKLEQYISYQQYHQAYHRYREIEAKINELAKKDRRVSVNTIGHSSEGRNLYLVRISSNPEANKPVILIDAGHHAREWISHSTIIYVMEALLGIDVPRMSANLCRSSKCRQSVQRKIGLNLDDFDYWFVPVVNPDGYEYSHTTDRLWRKTRSSSYCKGADPNRNYPFHWGESGVSKFSCSEVYAGPRALSEPEIRAMVNTMDTYKSRIAMYFSLHSYSQLILAPYGYARVKPSNYANMERVANAWIRSVGELRNTSYRFGTSSFVLYPASGCSDDYAHGVANIRYSYTIELPDTGRLGFVLPPSEIIPVGHEAVVGLAAMIDEYRRMEVRI